MAQMGTAYILHAEADAGHQCLPAVPCCIGNWRDLSLFLRSLAFPIHEVCCISRICHSIWSAKHITNGIYRSTDLALTWGLEKELAFSFAGPCRYTRQKLA